MSDRDREDLRRGVALFNRGEFWEAHEAWEAIWRRHGEDSRMFLQGLILAAAAFHTLFEKRNFIGTLRNLGKAIPRLALFPPEFLGLDVAALVAALRASREELRRRRPEGIAGMAPEAAPRIRWRPDP
ncbi:MAG: DUF309 domain-containing protein [Acidobacteria bacterium]|nr:DUF309 domain-containing protein [Acidobacteriota bacterium]